jgi:hypothetical protein
LEGGEKMISKVKIAAVVSSGALFLSAALPAFANEINIDTTGSHSSNRVSVNMRNTADLINRQDSNNRNNFSINANTGGNRANNNTGDGGVFNGGFNGSVDIVNHDSNEGSFLDNCLCGLLSSGSDNSGSISISRTGFNSNNTASVNVNNALRVTNTSNQSNNNSVNARINTGNNSASNNTGDGYVSSGDSSFNVTVQNGQ